MATGPGPTDSPAALPGFVPTRERACSRLALLRHRLRRTVPHYCGPVSRRDDDWIDSGDAAEYLGVSTSYLNRLGADGRIRRRPQGRSVQYATQDLVARRDLRRVWETSPGTWLSAKEVAEMAGVSRRTVLVAAAAGEITQREVPRRFRSLDASSAQAWAAARQARPPQLPRMRRPTGPPPEPGVWLDTNTAAAVLGMSRTGVSLMARQERIAATRYGTRWWFRRDHLELAAAARARMSHPKAQSGSPES